MLHRAFAFVRGGLPPVLGLCSHDVVDTIGGYDVTYAGLNLSSATVTVGGTSATITANTTNLLTFTMPPKPAGSHVVVVSTPNGSSTTTLFVESDPLFWLSADRASTAGTAAIGIPNSAKSAVDLSIAQSDPTKRPTYDAAHASFNGHPAIVHPADGLLRYLDSAVLGASIAQPLTFYMAVRYETTGGNPVLYDSTVNDGTRITLLLDGDTPWAYAGVGFSGGPNITHQTLALCVVYDDVSSAIYVNDSSTPTVIGNAGANVLASLRVGVHVLSILPFGGAWASLGAFAGAHDATARARNRDRLKTKYGIP